MPVPMLRAVTEGNSRRADSLPAANAREVTNVLLGARATRRAAIILRVKEDMAGLQAGIKSVFV